MSKKPKSIFRVFVRLALAVAIGVVLVYILNQLAGLPDNSGRESSQVISNGADSSLGKMFAPELAENSGKNGVIELAHGRDAFAARIVLARKAERSIDTQYYMWHQDTVGRSLVYALISAADRGVRVRLLVDDMYGSDGQDTWLAMNVHPNIDVRLFAPYSRRQPKYLQFVTRFHDVNARMHTKTFTVDNQATIVGGRNIGDEYFDADPDLAFADNDVLVIGPAVEQVSSNFDDYWNSDYAYPVATLLPAATDTDLQKLKDTTPAFMAKPESKSYFQAVEQGRFAIALRDGSVAFQWGSGKIVHDAWWKREQKREGWHDDLLIAQLKPYLVAATQELIMISPYFVPGNDTVKTLCSLAQKGVSVKILTNSLASNDVAAVHAGYTRFRIPLLRCGVELYELDEHLRAVERRAFTWLPGLSKSSLHAKTMVMDKKRMFVGSFNYDQRSLYLNTEIGLVFDQADIAGPAAEKFDKNINKVAFKVELVTSDSGKESLLWHGIEDGKPVTYDSEPYVGRGTKMAVWFIRWLPVNWLL
jgi:putative cardiolipin synthase